MKKKVLFSFIVFAATAVFTAGVFAADFELVYKMGRVETQKGGRWIEVAYGDRVPGDAPVRLAAGAVAEFDAPGGTVVFSRPGTYRLDSVAGTDRGARPTAVASVAGRLRKIGGGTSRGQTAVMGVRAKRADSGPDLGWVQEDDIMLEDAIRAYDRGDYKGAVGILEDEIDPAELQDGGAYWYILAASQYGLGRKGPAMKIVADYTPPDTSSYFGDFLFLKGLLFFESRDPSGAVESLSRYLGTAADDEGRQMGNFLLGQAYFRLGDEAKAKAALREAVNIGADAEISKLAAEMLR